MYVDVHCHLDEEILAKDLDRIIFECKDKEVVAVITAGTSPKSNRDALKIAKKYSIVKAALGIYPIEAIQKEGYDAKKQFLQEYGVNALTEKQIELEFEKRFMSLIAKEIDFIRQNKDKIVAIGEVGLDLYWTESLRFQKYVFERMIELTLELDLPIVVHCRNAEQQVFDILQAKNAKKVVIHCYGGPLEIAQKMIDAGYYFTIPTNVVRSKKVQKLVELLDISRIMTETDSPCLAPNPKETNYPYNVVYSVEKIAELKGLTVEETKNIIYMNYQKLFL